MVDATHLRVGFQGVENEQARPLGVLVAFQDRADFALRIKLCQDAPEPQLALAVAGHAVESRDHEHVAAVRAQETPHQVAGNPAGPSVIRTDIGEAPAIRDIVGERHHGDARCRVTQGSGDARLVGAGDDEA
jgi:hypothetical protein